MALRLSEGLGRTWRKLTLTVEPAGAEMTWDVRGWALTALKFAIAGALVPVGIFSLTFLIPIFPSWLLTVALIFCPSYIMFLATADCTPWDSCTVQALALVTAVNVLLYGFIGLLYGAARDKGKA